MECLASISPVMTFSDTYPTTITLSSWQRGWKRHWVKNSKSDMANFLNKVEQCFLCISYFIFFCTGDGFDFIVCIVLNSIDWFIHTYRVCLFTYRQPDKCTCLIITSLFMFMNFTVFCQKTCFHLNFMQQECTHWDTPMSSATEDENFALLPSTPG